MYILRQGIVALMLLVVLASPAGAQDATQSNVDVRLRLTLYGDVPVQDEHGTDVALPPSDAAYTSASFCGPRSAPLQPACTGSDQGVVYTDTVALPEGAYARLLYRRSNRDEFPYLRCLVIVRPGLTISAYYDYRTGQRGFGNGPGGQEDQTGTEELCTQRGGNNQQTGGNSQLPPQMPSAGAGGAASGFTARYGATAVLPLLLVGLDRLRRRHRE